MQAMALEWWLRPVSMHERDGEQSAVVCMLVYSRPFCASLLMFGVLIGEPKQPSWPKPVSSITMKSTFGAPGFARIGAGHAGSEFSMVRPMTPGKAVPGGYSLSSACAAPASAADAASAEPPPSRKSRRPNPFRRFGTALPFAMFLSSLMTRYLLLRIYQMSLCGPLLRTE